MSTHNMFSWRNKKNVKKFRAQSGAMLANTRVPSEDWSNCQKLHRLATESSD